MRRKPKNTCGYKQYKCVGLPQFNRMYSGLDMQSIKAVALSQDIKILDINKYDGSTYNNFLNIPRSFQGPTKSTSIQSNLSLSASDVSNLLDICTDLLDPFDKSNGSPGFIDLYNRIQSNLQSTHILQSYFYSQTDYSGNPIPVTKASVNQLAQLQFIKDTPGVLIPLLKPSAININTSRIVMPNTVNASTSGGSAPDVLDTIANIQGCSGPGVLYRASQGATPTFICLIQCV